MARELRAWGRDRPLSMAPGGRGGVETPDGFQESFLPAQGGSDSFGREAPGAPAPSAEASPGERCALGTDEGLHPNPSLRFSLLPRKRNRKPRSGREGCK